jgi:hypothetical protein
VPEAVVSHAKVRRNSGLTIRDELIWFNPPLQIFWGICGMNSLYETLFIFRNPQDQGSHSGKHGDKNKYWPDN